MGKPAAFDLSVTSKLNLNILLEAGVTAGAATRATELRKHEPNDGKCRELGWVCVSMVVEAYGEAMESLSRLASCLATSSNKARAAVLNSLYGRLNLNLVKANATAMLSGCFPQTCRLFRLGSYIHIYSSYMFRVLYKNHYDITKR